MSLFRTTTITCPSCGTTMQIDESDSVNGDRRPDLRQAIIDRTFQVFPCPSCDKPVRMQPQFNYLETGANLWVAAFPGAMMPDYIAVEDTVTAIFDNIYGAGAMQSAREIGKTLDLRLTFGWPGLREKLVLRSAGLDDVAVEMMKLDLLRRLPEVTMGPGIELRVIEVTEDGLQCAWVQTDSEAVMRAFTANRALYDSVLDNPEGWAPIRADLTNGPFVDIQKLYMGEGRAAAE